MLALVPCETAGQYAFSFLGRTLLKTAVRSCERSAHVRVLQEDSSPPAAHSWCEAGQYELQGMMTLLAICSLLIFLKGALQKLGRRNK